MLYGERDCNRSKHIHNWLNLGFQRASLSKMNTLRRLSSALTAKLMKISVISSPDPTPAHSRPTMMIPAILFSKLSKALRLVHPLSKPSDAGPMIQVSHLLSMLVFLAHKSRYQSCNCGLRLAGSTCFAALSASTGDMLLSLRRKSQLQTLILTGQTCSIEPPISALLPIST